MNDNLTVWLVLLLTTSNLLKLVSSSSEESKRFDQNSLMTGVESRANSVQVRLNGSHAHSEDETDTAVMMRKRKWFLLMILMGQLVIL